MATDTRTGQNQAEAIAAVLVHHDHDLYDLKVRASGRTAVIDTTSSHLFWDQDSRRWVKAAALKYGTHLRTPTGSTATVLGGSTPRDTTGWMWDLTIPGNNDHDFYIQTADTAILVHNCPMSRGGGGVYSLRDPETGAVVRTGRATNLYERQLDHARDPVLGQFRFQVEYRTNVANEQKGLEQMLYDQYPEAQQANGGYNKYSPIDPLNSDKPVWSSYSPSVSVLSLVAGPGFGLAWGRAATRRGGC
jgi:hypothetical protein